MEEIGCSEREEETQGIRRAAHKICTQGNSSWVRTTSAHLLFKGTNGVGHAEVIPKTCEDAGPDITGLQEVRRNGQSAFTAAG